MDERNLKFYGWRRVQDIEQWERVGFWEYGGVRCLPNDTEGVVFTGKTIPSAMNDTRPEWWRPVREDGTPFSDEIYGIPEPVESTMKYERRTTRLLVAPVGEPLFSELATTVSIVDEAAGEFIVVGGASGEVRIDRDEWPHIREAVEEMLKGIRG